MLARILVTGLVLLLAFGAFWGNALDAGHVLNPFGILLLFFAGVIWFMWDWVRESFIAAKDESNIPIIRLGSAIIGGLRRPPPPHRISADNSKT
jgi:hypothetical protein